MAQALAHSKFQHRDSRGRRSSVCPDINLTELAGSVGVGPDYLSKLFRGIGNPSVPLAQKLAGEMGISLEELLGRLKKQREKRAKEKGRGQGKRKTVSK